MIRAEERWFQFMKTVIKKPSKKEPRKEYASSSEEALDRLNMSEAEIGVPNGIPDPIQDEFASKQSDFINSVQ